MEEARMGMFRIEIEGQGGHGCSREIKDGMEVHGCGRRGCLDCDIRAFLADWKSRNAAFVQKAILTHWPGTPQEVQDDLLTRKRKGSF